MKEVTEFTRKVEKSSKFTALSVKPDYPIHNAINVGVAFHDTMVKRKHLTVAFRPKLNPTQVIVQSVDDYQGTVKPLKLDINKYTLHDIAKYAHQNYKF